MRDAAHKDEATARPGYLKGFWALMVTQFQGAFNDNALKLAVTLFLIARLAKDTRLHDYVIPVTQGIFFIPWIVFAGQAGALSDKFSKRTVTIWTKYWEMGVMLLVIPAFYIGNPFLLWGLFLLMAIQSTFFSPSKYGILPEMLPVERLSWGNGYLQMTTQIAIIAGTAVGGMLLDAKKWGIPIHLAVIPLFLLSVIGVLAAHFVTPVPAADPAKKMPLNPWHGLGRYMKTYASDRWLLLSLLGTVYFWFVGAFVLQNILAYGDRILGLAEAGIAMSGLTIALALGIGAGGVAAGYLSGGKIEGGLVPLGAFALTVFLALLGIPGWGYWSILVLLFFMGFSSGFYEIPLAATIQQRSPEDARGGMLAAMNVVTFIGMAVATGIFALLYSYLKVMPSTIFLVASVMTLLVGVVSVYFVPMYLVRLFLWFMAHTLYRLDVRGGNHVPVKTGALLVANHTSFIDALAIQAATDRPVRFLFSSELYEIWWIKPFAKAMRALPISTNAPPRQIIESMRQAKQAIADGEIVCIFAEGQITRTGQLLPFKKGMEHIAHGIEAPVVPVYLDRLWGSIFSFAKQRFFWKLPRRIPYHLTVNFGEPMPANTPAAAVRQRIQELGSEAYVDRRLDSPLVHRRLIKVARRHPGRMALADMKTDRMSYFKALVASIILARKLNRLLDDRKMVGILVPPTIGGALTNVAVQIMGKVAVNLNYTASADSLKSAADQSELRHVITSRQFLERLPIVPPGEPIYLEDVMETVTSLDRIRALLMAAFFPVRLLERSVGSPSRRSQNDLAAIIFSSGSTGTPKGAMITHSNLLSNIDAALQVFPHEPEECMLGILPFFHSFGFMGTLWLPLTYGFRVAYFPSPLEAKAVGLMCAKHRCTFLIATNTFFQNYIRRCAPEDFSSVKYALAGAEKLTERVREAFKAKFGIEPLEGYGATECSPVISLNCPDFRAPGFFQVGTKRGSVGHPLPGISTKTIDPETNEDLPFGATGLLCVKGPNVMQGYLKMPEQTAEVLHDGWYNTGDVTRIDEDGFIWITDRLARFSKIAGEMVPHQKVEETLHELLGLTEQAFAVVGVPDAQKGERLVVLHTVADDQLQELFGKLDKSGLPKLWVPRSNAFYRVEEIPVLGTGKLDLQRSKALARTLDVGE